MRNTPYVQRQHFYWMLKKKTMRAIVDHEATKMHIIN